MDMVRLFEKGRRFFQDQTAEYGHVLTLQRLYNALTATYPMALPPSGVPEPSPLLFASLPAGPGNARSMHETNQELRAGVAEEDVGFGVTTFRVGTKERIFTDEARHKGVAYRLGMSTPGALNADQQRRLRSSHQSRRRDPPDRRTDFQNLRPHKGLSDSSRHRVLVLSTRTDRPYGRSDVLRERGLQNGTIL